MYISARAADDISHMSMKSTLTQLVQDRRITWILISGLVLQTITSVTQTGAASADQHFQIIEFSLNQLGRPSGAPYVWEYTHFVRPTLQVYLFSGYHIALNSVGITDPYTQLTILRITLGLAMFAVFNLLAIYYFKYSKESAYGVSDPYAPSFEIGEPHAGKRSLMQGSNKNLLLLVLLLMNFSWALPYSRTIFSSEMLSSLFFYGTLLLYEENKEKAKSILFPILIGLLFSLAFYFRFQTGSFLLGFGIWLVFFEKRYKHILPIAIGFFVGVIINMLLDYGYYKEWVFTPYAYYHVNINEGRATQFGTSSFLRYIGLLILVAPAPFFSIIFLYYSIKTFLKKYSNPVFLSTILFILLHSMVGHKEERFMFPVFNAMPIIIGWSIPYLDRFYASTKKWIRGVFKFLMWFTIGLNMILLIAITCIPYAQTIRFSEKIKNRFHNARTDLYTLGQTPFQSPNRSPMVFYKNGAPNITVHRLSTLDSVIMFNSRIEYLATTYNEIKDKRSSIDSMGFKPVMYSNKLLWKVNEMLDRKKVNTINEIWVLFTKEQ
jgi:GPI mannosyltransferase 3